MAEIIAKVPRNWYPQPTDTGIYLTHLTMTSPLGGGAVDMCRYQKKALSRALTEGQLTQLTQENNNNAQNFWARLAG